MKAQLDYRDLQTLLAEWKINSFRYDAYVRSIVIRELNRAQKSILASVLSEDFGSVTKRDLQRLTRKINTIIDENYDRIESFLEKTGKDFFIASHQVEAFVYNQWLGANLITSLPKYKLEAIKVTPLFEGRPLGDWWARQRESLKFNVETAIRSGNVIGETPYNIAKEIRNKIGITQRQAETLVRTANSSISSAAQERLIDTNKDILYAKQHVSTLDSRTTSICQHRDGLKWKIDGTPIGHSLPFIEPPLHPNCRSIVIMVIDKNAESTRASEFGQVDASLRYEDWLKDQPDAYQDQVLGKRKARWFRENKLNLSQMLDQSERPLTIEQLRNRYSLR